MLIGGNAGGQDLGDDRVGNDRKAEVDSPGGSRILEIVNFTQGQYKGEDPILVVKQDIPGLSSL